MHARHGKFKLKSDDSCLNDSCFDDSDRHHMRSLWTDNHIRLYGPSFSTSGEYVSVFKSEHSDTIQVEFSSKLVSTLMKFRAVFEPASRDHQPSSPPSQIQERGPLGKSEKYQCEFCFKSSRRKADWYRHKLSRKAVASMILTDY